MTLKSKVDSLTRIDALVEALPLAADKQSVAEEIWRGFQAVLRVGVGGHYARPVLGRIVAGFTANGVGELLCDEARRLHDHLTKEHPIDPKVVANLPPSRFAN